MDRITRLAILGMALWLLIGAIMEARANEYVVGNRVQELLFVCDTEEQMHRVLEKRMLEGMAASMDEMQKINEEAGEPACAPIAGIWELVSKNRTYYVQHEPVTLVEVKLLVLLMGNEALPLPEPVTQYTWSVIPIAEPDTI